MTDKQIIIDGCNVSKCIYFQQEDDEYTCGAEECNGAIVACRACDNCYYKQLKRKEQRIVELNKTIKAKEQECEELKEEIKKHNDDMFKNPPEKRFYCKGCTLPYISKKLKQTLTEIKEIARVGAFYWKHYKEESKRYNEILQKISECEGNDELTK